MIKLYNKELSLNIISRYIYEYFKTTKVDIVYTDKIDINDEDLYLILGGEYLIHKPKKYGIIQLLPTSHLTLSQNVQAYWIDQEYLDLLKNAEFILDLSQENIKVWKEFYQFQNVFYFDWNYQSCLLRNKEYYQIDKKNIFIIGEKRGKKLNKDKKYEILNDNNWLEIVDYIKNKCGIVVFISDYEHTYPNLPLVSYLRYNNIPCIVEKSRDKLLNSKCEVLGCHLYPYIRLEKNLVSIIDKLENKDIKISKKILPSLPENFLTQFELKTMSNKIKIKNKNKLDLYDRKTISSVEFDILEDGGISLKLSGIDDEQLPNITILTPTYNRRWIFPLAIRNFFEFNYPKDKIKWIILDDGDKPILDIIPNDKRIKYVYLDKKITIGEKRNKLVEMSETEIVVFMDDDDYYPPESLIARVKSLLKYEKSGIECVGCIDVASYDLKNDNCAICSNGKSYFCESSLAFYKKFWVDRNFYPQDTVGEFRKFLEYRQNKVKNLPFQFVTIAFAHGKNTTGDVRTLNTNLKETSEIKQLFDEDLLDFMKQLKKYLS